MPTSGHCADRNSLTNYEPNLTNDKKFGSVREEDCSTKQRQNFKGIKCKITKICKNTSRVFGATCQKFNKKSKSDRLRVEKQ